MSGKASGGGGAKAGASQDQPKSDKDSKGRRTAPSMTQSKASIASSKGSGRSQQSKASSTSSKSSGRSQQSKVSRRGTVGELKPTSSTKAKPNARKASATKILDMSTQERASKARDARRRSDLNKTAGADAKTKEQADSGAKQPSGLKVANPDDEAALGGEEKAQSKVRRKSVVGKSASGKPGTSDEVAANIVNIAAAPMDGGPKKTDGKTSVKGGAGQSRFSALKSLLRRKSLAVLNAAKVGKFATRRAPKPPRENLSSTVQRAGTNQPAAASDARRAASKLLQHEESGHSELDSQQQRFLALGGALSLTVLMLIFFSVVTYFLTSGTTSVIVACDTSECIAAKDYVEGLLGDPRDRCTDFYSYVCARLIQHHSSVNEGAFERLHDGLLRERGTSGDKLGGHVAATVYSGCHVFLDSEESLADEMREIGHSIMTAPLRSAANFSEIVQLLVRISFQRGLHTVLVIGLVRFADDLRASLHLSPGKSILRKFHMTSYDHFESNLKAAFAWAPEVVSTSDALKDLVDIDKRIEEALASSDDEGVEVYGTLRSFVGGLIGNVDVSAWVNAVKDADPSVAATSAESGCFAETFISVRGAFRQLTAVGLRKAASYLAANLEAEFAFLEDARQNLKEDDAAKRRLCLEMARRSVALTWHSLVARILNSAAHEASVRDMFGALREVFDSNDIAFTWLDREVRRAALDRLNGTALTFIGADKAQHVNASYAKFMPVIAEAKDFMSGYMSALKETQWMQMLSPPTRWGALYASMKLTASIEYEPRLHSIVVPPLLLTEPYFYGKSLPRHFNYGTVGSLLSSRIAEVLGAEHPKARASDNIGREGKLQANESDWSVQSLNRYRKSLKCLQELRARLDSGSDVSGPQHGHINVLLAWAQGLRVAYEALLTWFTAVAGDSDRFQHHWHAAQVLFFARFCLLSCSADHRSTTAVPGRDRCLLPLHNMRQFAETFECEDAKDFVAANCPL